MISQRVRTIEPSVTLQINSLRLALQSEGKRVYNFGVGEPDSDTPEFVRRAAQRAVDEGWTRYTPVPGSPQLRQAVARGVCETRHVDVDSSQVLITGGAKQALAEFFLARVDPGDEVILPAPYWVSYPEMIRLAEGTVVVAPTEPSSGYRPRAAQLETLVTPRTVGLVLNSPGNPTGAVYTEEVILELVEFARRHDLWIVSDEIYENFTFDAPFVSVFALAPERTTLIDGVSKSFAMTGWRIGWAVSTDKDLVAGMGRLQAHTASNAAAVSQAAAIAALDSEEGSAFLDETRREYRARRDFVVKRLGAIPNLGFFRPEGAFYAFMDLQPFLGRAGLPSTSAELCHQLLDRRGVALVPGEAFGAPGGARLSFACSMQELEEGIDALEKGLVV